MLLCSAHHFNRLCLSSLPMADWLQGAFPGQKGKSWRCWDNPPLGSAGVTATPHRGAQLRSSLPSPPRTAGWQVRCWLDHHQHLQFRKGEIKKEIAVVGGDRKHEAKLRCLFPLAVSQSVSGFLILPTHPTADRRVTLSLQASPYPLYSPLQHVKVLQGPASTYHLPVPLQEEHKSSSHCAFKDTPARTGQGKKHLILSIFLFL